MIFAASGACLRFSRLRRLGVAAANPLHTVTNEDGRVELVQGDICRQAVDAIVNAANPSLLGGGGVDGAIHAAGGPQILAECRRIGGCPPGEARVTGAGRLPAKFVIHAVGPVFRGGGAGEAEILGSAYRESIRQAAAVGARRIAFPSISTGAYGYPLDDAVPIALRAIADGLAAHPRVRLVRLVAFDRHTFAAYARAMQRHGAGAGRAS